MTLRTIQRVSQRPRIYQIDNFASPLEVEHILWRADDLAALRRQGVLTKHDAAGFSFEMQVDGDPLLEAYRTRLNETIGVASIYDLTMRFRRYAPGEGHPVHVDTYEINGYTLIITAILYLTAPSKGGATRFPLAQPEPIDIYPKPGRLAIWFSASPDGTDDDLSMHEGCLVEDGFKTTLTYFIYEDRSKAATIL